MNEEIKDKSQIRKCPLCGKEYLKPQRYCQKCDMLLMRLSEYERLGMEENRANFQKAVEIQENIINESNVLKCPKCGSTAVTTGERGYNLLTGFIGSNQTMNRCGNCGYKWKPRG